ncbi:Intraflagellar transport protein 81 [Rhizophlyctis rosea]|nr:Intraflagellar transport protein 81 [Rhizophlyctis rosea]
MPTAADLKLISEKLSEPPFKRSFSVIQLHDELDSFQLLQTLNDVIQYIDNANPNSIHRGTNIRTEIPDETVARIGDFLRVLKYKGLPEWEEFRTKLLTGDREIILDALAFLLRDVPTHKKRAYLAPYLAAIDVPPEFMQDDVTADLSKQLSDLQSQFKEIHRHVDQMKQSGNSAAIIKREIQQMEDEKQQVSNKIGRLRKKVEDVPNHEKWLDAARSLRTEQQNEAQIADRIKEQKNQVLQSERKLTNALQTLKEVRAAFASAGPDLLYSKMEEDFKMNKYLATENLPKAGGMCCSFAGSDLKGLEDQIKELNDTIAKLAEQKLVKSASGDDKLALFRQQAAIIARKKEGTATKLKAATDEVSTAQEELNVKKESAKGAAGTKMMKGEELKRYVSELRGKSTVYKRKKTELSELTAEFGILQRTEEILKGRVKSLEDALSTLERKGGVLGFHAAQENLEKMSERKAEVDEAKGNTLNEISSIVDKLVASINEKKAHLSPIIQEMRTLRQQAQDLETEYTEKKKAHDALMVGLDSEAIQLDQEVKGYRQDIQTDQSRMFYLNLQIEMLEIAHDRVMQEMKAYIGGDDALEAMQKARGFKTYRELYNKKITEAENAGRALRESQKEVKAKHEPNMKQLAMFTDVKKLLALKASYNKKVLSGGGKAEEVGTVTQDRLVL